MNQLTIISIDIYRIEE